MKKFLFLFLLIVVVSVPTVVLANFGLDATAQESGLKGYGSNLPQLVGGVVGTALSMISVLFFILVVYGGVLWMTARGNEDQVKKAFNTIVAASIGLIIVLSSYALTTFVFNAVGGSGGGGAGGAGGTGGADGGGDGEGQLVMCQCAVEYSFVDNYNLDEDGNEDVCIFTEFSSGMTQAEQKRSCEQSCNGNAVLTAGLSSALAEGLEAQVVVEEINKYPENDIDRAVADAENICGPYVDRSAVLGRE